MGIPEIFACEVFNDEVMKKTLSKEIYNKLSKTAQDGDELDITVANEVAEAMKTEHDLKADIHYIDNNNKAILQNKFPGLAKELDVVANGGNAFYTSQGHFAVAPKSKPSLMLHELGHATNFEKSKFFRGLQKLKVFGMFAPMALAFLNDITGKRKDGKENFIERNAGIIGFSAFLPTIIEEAAASIRGIKAAKKTLPKVNLGALKRNYFFAWMTYVLAGVGVGLASKLAITERKVKKGSTSEEPENNQNNLN
jgi:hypothetical protein